MDGIYCFECLYYSGVLNEEFGYCLCPFCSAVEVVMYDEACEAFAVAPEFDPL